MLHAVPKLTDLLADPGKVSQVPLSAIPDLRAELARLDSLLLTHLLMPNNGQVKQTPEGDRLLTVDQAARKLGMSKDYLYRNNDHLPFTVRLGIKQVRFSEQGIEKFIKNRVGR